MLDPNSLTGVARVNILAGARRFLANIQSHQEPSVLEQIIVDLEKQMDSVKEQAVIANGEIRTVNREVLTLGQKVDTGKMAIQKILASGDPNATTAAQIKGKQVVADNEQLEAAKARYASAQQTADAMRNVIVQLNVKHDELLSALTAARSMDADTHAANQSAQALTYAAKVTGGVSKINVNGMKTRLQGVNDQAHARLDAAMGSDFGGAQEDPETQSKVDDLLASLQPAAVAK